MIIIATISVLVIASLFWIINHILDTKVCPICVGVSGTWIWILIGIWTGLLEVESWRLIVAILMGGSVVGIAYQLEKKIQPEKRMAWKIFFIPAGMLMAHGLIQFSWLYLILSSAIVILLFYIFISGSGIEQIAGRNEKEISDIENKMKNCC